LAVRSHASSAGRASGGQSARQAAASAWAAGLSGGEQHGQPKLGNGNRAHRARRVVVRRGNGLGNRVIKLVITITAEPTGQRAQRTGAEEGGCVFKKRNEFCSRYRFKRRIWRVELLHTGVLLAALVV
jgi:hypothetical protein